MSAPGGQRWPQASETVRRALESARRLTPEWRDSTLYFCSAGFAGFTAVFVGIPLYRQWGQMATGPYLLASVVMAVVAWRRGARAQALPAGVRGGPPGGSESAPRPQMAVPGRGARVARVVAFLIVLFGATVVPLTMEVIWRSEGNAAMHVQPEVLVVERAGARAADGHDPYRVVDRDGHIVIHQAAEPVYELYYPYLPGMVIFGFSSVNKMEARLTDARIQFLVFTALVAVVGLSRLRPRTDARLRALQVLTILPTAALPLATGGDDMPVVGLMLLGLVALQRRRPLLAGLALGAASSLKFTAWPLAVLALFAARDLALRRSIGRYAAGVVAVVVPAVLPLAIRNPSAFIDNVVRFPLGLAGVSSPAASALPGHVLVSAFPGAHRPYVLAVAIMGGAVLVVHLWRHPPGTPARVAALTGWVMLVAILLAPATRVGYMLYPINLFVWAWMLRRADEPAVAVSGGSPPGVASSDAAAAGRAGPGQLSSLSSNSSRENGVVPVEVVGNTTAPTSQ